MFNGILSLVAVLAIATPGHAAPGYGEPLTLTRGLAVTVKTIRELELAINAANSAAKPATVLLADGVYTLRSAALHLDCDGLVIRSASGNRDKVIVRGPDQGPKATAAHIFLVSASDVVIADLTLGYCRFHGIQVRGEEPHNASGLHVHNCRLVNCNEQFIKGSSSKPDPVGARDGIIENCLFEFTSGWAYQYYTGGIDIHKGVNWIVRDNLFRNLRVPNDQKGMAEHAIHFWNRCDTEPQNITVERNRIVNCDRGIGFGLINEAGGHNGGTSTIRNNMISNDGAGHSTDAGISLECADHVTITHNTVHIVGYRGAIEYRFPSSTHLTIRNNLVNHPILRRNDAPPATCSGNIESVQPRWFRDLAGGDLHLTAQATPVIDQADAGTAPADDIDRQSRPAGRAADIGSDEYVAE
ncbi:hypothetical protein [Haloferula sp. A504]|uniref:hypothetical protein n=1 Tax=Haloferula sp. A504 TaxID=3373601 RepID=UPI0031C96187|nr:right-handed parallel beta-helix repeat-containing protein [Verrucomicrobiaceae bacterium E54]